MGLAEIAAWPSIDKYSAGPRLASSRGSSSALRVVCKMAEHKSHYAWLDHCPRGYVHVLVSQAIAVWFLSCLTTELGRTPDCTPTVVAVRCRHNGTRRNMRLRPP